MGTALALARTPEEAARALGAGRPDLVIVDLTTEGWDHAALLAALEAGAPGVPVLGFTTHALARQTQPLHGRCARVVTKETLTLELATILKEGIPA